MHKLGVKTTRVAREWGHIRLYTRDVLKTELKTPTKACQRNITIIKIQTQTTLSLKIYNGTGEGMDKVLNCSCLQNSIQQTQNDIG